MYLINKYIEFKREDENPLIPQIEEMLWIA